MVPQELFEKVVAECPAFGAVVAEHLKDNDGELLAHLLMADLRRFVGSGLGTDSQLGVSPPTYEEIQRILTVLDLAFTAGDDSTETSSLFRLLSTLKPSHFSLGCGRC